MPLHPACPHGQAISGVFSVASHSVLQYLPDVVTHEQTGCAHFSAFSGSITLLPTSDLTRTIQALMLVTRKKCFCTERNTLRYRLHALCEWLCQNSGTPRSRERLMRVGGIPGVAPLAPRSDRGGSAAPPIGKNSPVGVVVVFSLKCLLAVLPAAFWSGNRLDCLA